MSSGSAPVSSCIKKGYHIRLYRAAPHGWLNDTMPGRYRKEAAQHAWRLLLLFLNRTLRNGGDGGRVLWTFESDMATNYDFTKNVRLEYGEVDAYSLN